MHFLALASGLRGNVNKGVVKTGAYLLFILGIIISLALLFGGVFIFIYFPEGNMQKKALSAGGLVIAAVLVFLMALSLFESITEVTKLEEEVGELEEDKKSYSLPKLVETPKKDVKESAVKQVKDPEVKNIGISNQNPKS